MSVHTYYYRSIVTSAPLFLFVRRFIQKRRLSASTRATSPTLGSARFSCICILRLIHARDVAGWRLYVRGWPSPRIRVYIRIYFFFDALFCVCSSFPLVFFSSLTISEHRGNTFIRLFTIFIFRMDIFKFSLLSTSEK